MDRKKMGARNKRIGHDAERYYVNIFCNLGFKYCTTARLGSRLYDNAKIDLINLPFNVQIKAGLQKGLNPGRELFNMTNMIKSLFPPEDIVHKKDCFLIHKKPVGTGLKPTIYHQIVYMSKDTFDKYKLQIPNLLYHKEKKFKFSLDSPYRHIVAITFDEFRDEILNKIYLKNDSSNTTRTD